MSGGRASKTLILLSAVLGGLLLASPFLIRAFVIEAFQIPQGGMLPTLEVGDHIFCSKLPQDVRRGDVVVFKYPPEPGTDYIKRVIALGGDSVEVTADGVVILNGQPVPRRQVSEPCALDMEEGSDCGQWEETVDKHTFKVVHGQPHAFRAVVVPQGSVFVMGDNRENSSDSRFWGFVPLANIKGRALVIWWSAGPKGTRWERVNRSIP